jgi:hypothetical protein
MNSMRQVYVIEKFVQLYLLKLQFEAGKHTERDMQRNRKIYIISGSYMIPKNLVNILKALFHILKTLFLYFFIEVYHSKINQTVISQNCGVCLFVYFSFLLRDEYDLNIDFCKLTDIIVSSKL